MNTIKTNKNDTHDIYSNNELNISNIMRETNTVKYLPYDYTRNEYIARHRTYRNIFSDKVRMRSTTRKSIRLKRSIKWSNHFVYQHVKQNKSLLDSFDVLVLDNSEMSLSSDEYHMQTERLGEGLDILNAVTDKDDMWNMLESMILFYDDVQRCNSPRQVTLSCLRMVKMVCHGSVIQKILKSGYFKKLMSTIEDEIQGTFEDGLDQFRNAMEFMTDFKKTELYKKVYRLCMYVLTFSLFENCGLSFSTFGYNLFEEEAIRKKYFSRPKFLFALMDTLSFLMKKGLQIIQSGRVDAIFHSGDTYAKWFDDVAVIRRHSKLLCNPEAHGFNEFSFRQDLDSAIERGESIRLAVEDNSLTERRMIVSLLNELKSIKCDLCTKTAARERRSAPFSVLVCGGS